MHAHTAAVLDRLRTEAQLAQNGDKPILERSFNLAIAEIERMHPALERAHVVLSALVAPNPQESAIHIYARAVEAEARARSTLGAVEGTG